MTTGKTIALTRQTFVWKVMSIFFIVLSTLLMGFPGGAEVKASACNLGDLGSIPGWGRFPGEGNDSILAWRIPWTEGPGGLQSTGCKEPDMTERL